MNTDINYLSEIQKSINIVKDSSENNEVIKLFKNGDTRKTFFEMLASSLRVYYLGMCSSFIVEEKLLDLSKSDSIHIENFNKLLLSNKLVLENIGNIGIGIPSPKKNFNDIYSDILKMNLINDCWVCFESALRNIDHELNIIHPRNNKPVSVYDIYTHKKFNTETDFLIFFGNCRNAMHNNSIHTKEIFRYTLQREKYKKEFIFKKGEKIFITKQDILEMIEKLSNVALDMWINLNHPDFISDRYNNI